MYHSALAVKIYLNLHARQNWATGLYTREYEREKYSFRAAFVADKVINFCGAATSVARRNRCFGGG